MSYGWQFEELSRGPGPTCAHRNTIESLTKGFDRVPRNQRVQPNPVGGFSFPPFNHGVGELMPDLFRLFADSAYLSGTSPQMFGSGTPLGRTSFLASDSDFHLDMIRMPNQEVFVPG
jgi:hypothetical protein